MRPDYIPIWLRKPIPLLGDDKPLDVIAAGDYRRVAELISGPRGPGRGLSMPTHIRPRSRSAANGGATTAPAADPWQRPWPPATTAGSAATWSARSTSPIASDRLGRVVPPPGRARDPADRRCRVTSGVGRSTSSASQTCARRAALRAQALAAPRPGRAEWPPFQRAGEALHQAGWPALVAPSAARPSGVVLCIFRAADRPAGLEPSPPANATTSRPRHRAA